MPAWNKLRVGAAHNREGRTPGAERERRSDFGKTKGAPGEVSVTIPGELPVSGDQRRRSPGIEPQRVPEPWEEIDERNDWRDANDQRLGAPPANATAFDPEERISLCAEEAGRLFQWLMFGGSVRNRDRTKAVNLRLKHICEKRDFASVLKRPQLIGFRLVAMLLRLRPDLLQGLCAAELARRLKISPRALAYHTISFGENFPVGSKAIRRTSRLVKEEQIRARHLKKL